MDAVRSAKATSLPNDQQVDLGPTHGECVCFGSKPDMCSAPTHVCFTPKSDRESEFPQKAMSALPPKADMCSAITDVRFGPKADIAACPWEVRLT